MISHIKFQIKTLVLSTALLLGLATPVLYTASTYAQQSPFNSAKSEACAGARLTKTSNPNCGEESQNKLSKTLKDIINLLTIIIGIVSVIMIIISGFRFITSNGDSNSIASARNTLIYAIVGLIIVAFAQLIVKFVLTRI